ncbi:MAG: HicB_like antitoxin of bacterial toxin-antitoxinsystem [Candidatus Argoarchaeum ethanivorans]|uniref:HicB_like antitoxin of bacterial toxin-antitoxinsystem n=1 Tax=Candidatus Argoarchaeum ethanivorans TaxID=2608793 RepID=A0A811TA93_9EURY|nr:MAG: HicB_like antitoxin of bacterial toxin-antitoxinsystem [Candidatus Argoarchaeum ethanivorans]
MGSVRRYNGGERCSINKTNIYQVHSIELKAGDLVTKERFIVLIERDEDDVFIGTVPAIKGCYSYGNTLDELMANVKEAIEAHIEAFGSEEKNLTTTKFAGIQELELKV